jgi:hypothetical protein
MMHGHLCFKKEKNSGELAVLAEFIEFLLTGNTMVSFLGFGIFSLL